MWSRLGAWLDLMLNALLWGSLTVVGGVVVPMLFMLLSPKALAGMVAGELFVMESVLVLGVSLFALLRKSWTLWFKAIGERSSLLKILWAPGLNLVLSIFMLLVVIGKVTQSEPQERALWHGLGSAVYALMWLLSAKQLSEFTRSKA